MFEQMFNTVWQWNIVSMCMWKDMHNSTYSFLLHSNKLKDND